MAAKIKYCRWIYRPGIENSHWAMTCKKTFNYLSKIDHCEPYIGCADVYNDRLCPICNRPIKMDYCIIENIVSEI